MHYRDFINQLSVCIPLQVFAKTSMKKLRAKSDLLTGKLVLEFQGLRGPLQTPLLPCRTQTINRRFPTCLSPLFQSYRNDFYSHVNEPKFACE